MLELLTPMRKIQQSRLRRTWAGAEVFVLWVAVDNELFAMVIFANFMDFR